MPYHFTYISKHNPEVQKAFKELQIIIGKVQDEVRDKLTFQFSPVGSYSRNMITYDPKSNIGFDFDFNLDIWKCDDALSAKDIKDLLRNAFTKYGKEFGYSPAEDSTRVLTIKVIDKKHSRIIHSCDFCIVNNYYDDNDVKHQEYIRFDKVHNKYSWCEQSKGFYMLPEKMDWLKENDLWQEFREYYLEKKDYNPAPEELHSRDLLVQTAHELCQQNGYYV